VSQEVGEHEPGEGEVVVSGERLGEVFVVPGESAEACGSGEASFHYPASRQQDKAALCLGTLDDLQLDAVAGCGTFSGLSGIALIDISKFHMVSGNPLQRVLSAQCQIRHYKITLIIAYVARIASRCAPFVIRLPAN